MLTSPTPPAAVCTQCTSPAGRFDRFCGICGTHLARLRWQDSGGAWQEGTGPFAVTESTKVARIAFENDGVVSLGLILDSSSLDSLPGWIDIDALRGREYLLLPKAELSVEIPLLEDVLLSHAELERPDTEIHPQEARLSFLTSSSDRPLELYLVLAFQPSVHPKASLYRYLPIERLRLSEGVIHEIQLHNASATITTLDRIEIEDDPVAPPPGYTQIPAKNLLRKEVRLPLPLPAGKHWTHKLRLKAATELSLPEGSLGWFSATVRYELLFNNERQEVLTRLSGAVGRGPTLELRGPDSFTSITPDPETQHSFVFRNPGQLPVEIQAIDVLRERDGKQVPAPDPDWLELKGLTVGDLVAPGEERTLVVGLRPDARPPDEDNEKTSRRTLVIRHDGWQEPAARQISCRVVARFGSVRDGTLGIDFGTTNSVACLMGDTHGYPLMLEAELRSDQLASLIYFDGSSAATQPPKPFLFGDEAKGAAAIEPANLVRSIKTVVIDGAKTGYDFLKKMADGTFQHLSVAPQELLNLFIRQVRIRAERGVDLLSPETLHREGFNNHRIVFRNAVFSHPVDITETMKVALMQAAQRAGINSDFQTPEDFFEERCVDEATAAVLAYINQLILNHSEGKNKHVLNDLEKILCVDIGGGTTDIAAIAVKDMAAYALEKTARVTVELCNRDGDRHFAGDTLDRLLAREVLAEIERQSQKQGAPILVDEVMHAVLSPSFMAYQARFKERLKSDPRRRQTGQSDPYAVYYLATKVIEAAESAKRAFTSETQVKKTFTGTGWPRERDDSAVAAQNFEVVLQSEVFESIASRELSQPLLRLDRVIAGARWDWASVTTLLLTGQSMRSPFLRRPIIEYVRQKMGEAAESLIVVEPGDSPEADDGFDPKACVAIGAAIWGISRTKDDAWLAIRKPFLNQLTFDLTKKGGHRYIRIEGLKNGDSLPAKGLVEFPSPRRELVLYRDTQKYLQFNFPKPATKITVCADTLADFFVEIDGAKFRGEIIQ